MRKCMKSPLLKKQIGDERRKHQQSSRRIVMIIYTRLPHNNYTYYHFSALLEMNNVVIMR